MYFYMQLDTLQRKNKRLRSRQVGRGGRRGKTSGRGTKGQKARSGHKMRPEIRDIIKKLPRLRGRGKHSLKSIQKLFFPLNLGILDRAYLSGETVNAETLQTKGIVSKRAIHSIKILGGGAISKALTVSNIVLSPSAKAKIEKAGGTVTGGATR